MYEDWGWVDQGREVSVKERKGEEEKRRKREGER